MFFDTHAHYDFKPFDKDRHELLGKTLLDGGVGYILNVGTDMQSTRASIKLANTYDHVYATAGFHPHYTKNMVDSDLQIFADFCAKFSKIVAIGEIGLDFFHNFSPKDVQIRRFEQQLELALQLKLPVVVHCREADDEVFDILKKSRAGEIVGGVFHCYAGNVTRARQLVEQGFHIGVGGVVTYKKSDMLREVVATTPKDRIVIETDCPYLAPEPHRGSRNDSRNLTHIAAKIAQIWGSTIEDVAQVTTQNAKKLFGIMG